MLTRLQVTGFKNLADVDVRFGPFTCVAGPNGVGKSNLFDAIRFLSSLADKPFVDAAKCVRDESQRAGEVRALFHERRDGPVDRMRFVADMIVPREGVDPLGLKVEARTTFLRYTLELGFVASGPDQLGDRLKLLWEELTYVKTADHLRELPFAPSDAWVNTAVVVKDKTKRSQYISTGVEKASGVLSVYMHADGGKHTKTPRPAAQLNRTLLSAATSLESPTAALARLEMQSWRLLQLEPSSLRAPSEFGADKRLGADGANLPATLYRLANGPRADGAAPDPRRLYDRVSLRLQQLIEDIRRLDVDRDEKRQLLTLVATDRDEVRLAARSLSDGTLRFLALSVLEEDEEAVGVLCFEEPENGIHPARIPAMLKLLQDIAVDPAEAVGPGNPLRQVIVNTHSPLVVNGVPDDALLGAVVEEYAAAARGVKFRALPGTWRAVAEPPGRALPLGELLAYLAPPLGPVVPVQPAEATPAPGAPAPTRRPRQSTLVSHRADVRSLFEGFEPR